MTLSRLQTIASHSSNLIQTICTLCEMGEGMWSVGSPSISIFRNPSQPIRSRAELSWWPPRSLSIRGLTCLKCFDFDSAPHWPWRTWETSVTDLWQVDPQSWESRLLWDEVYRLYMKKTRPRLPLHTHTHTVVFHPPDSHTVNLTLGHRSRAWAEH